MGGRGGGSKKGGGGGGGGLTEAEQAYMEKMRPGSVSVDGEEKYVAEWFMNKNNIARIEGSAGKETEKAVLVNATYRNVAYGSKDTGTQWVPKSVLQTKKQYAEAGVAGEKRYLGNMGYTKYLKETAAANGVKIGNTSSWDKIQAKLTSKGVKFKKRNQF